MAVLERRRRILVWMLSICRFSKAFPIVARSFSSLVMTTGNTDSSRRVLRTFDVHPISSLPKLRSKFPTKTKVVHVIRHAQGTHNVNKEYREPIHLDARLTAKGKQQCESFAQKCREAPKGSTLANLLQNTELVVTSTMTRCIETALHCFPTLPGGGTKFVAHESIRETVNYACDSRRPLSEIANDFAHVVDLSHVQEEHDEIWNAYVRQIGGPSEWTRHRESAELHKVAERGRQFLTWLQTRDEAEVVVCSHAAFLRCLLNWSYGVPMKPEQLLAKTDQEGEPIFRYHATDEHPEFDVWMRTTYDNCELRSFVMVFPDEA